MRISAIFIVLLTLLCGGMLGPGMISTPKLSDISAHSVRVNSIIKPPPRRVYVGGSSGRSGRYSSGGGFSSGK